MHHIVARPTVQRQYDTTLFLSKEISKKSWSLFILRCPFFAPKTTSRNETIFVLGKIIRLDSKRRDKRNTWTKHNWKPPDINESVGIPFDFYFPFVLSRPQVCTKPQPDMLQEMGELFGWVPNFYFHGRATALKECLNMHVDCIRLFSLS